MLCSAALDIIGIWFGCFPRAFEPHEYRAATNMKKKTNEDAGEAAAEPAAEPDAGEAAGEEAGAGEE